MFRNIKAEQLIDRVIDNLLAYLEVDPRKKAYLSSINAKNRNDLNGFANFKLTYIDLCNLNETRNIRLETNVFDDHLYLRPQVIKHIQNADIIIFFDRKSDSVFIADKVINNNHNWLKDTSIRYSHIDSNNKVYFKYNLEILLHNHAVVQLFRMDDKIRIVHDSLGRYFNQEVLNANVYKKVSNYSNCLNKVYSYVQSDVKMSETIYYCLSSETEANKPATLKGIAKQIWAYTKLTELQTYKKLFDACAKNGYAKFECISNDERIKNLLNSNGEIEIGLSKVKDTKLTKVIKKSNDAEYHKRYIKVKHYIGRDHTEPNKKWPDEDKELFYEIINK